jgi:chromatin remodeling complex protein RSC6
MKPVTPDEKMAKVIVDKPFPRTKLTKKLWAYIRKNGFIQTPQEVRARDTQRPVRFPHNASAMAVQLPRNIRRVSMHRPGRRMGIS